VIEQLINSAICWAIILLAFVCYQQLFCQYLAVFNHKNNDQLSLLNTRKLELSKILIGALPLIGLLGTIGGLLECFAGIASKGASSELISSGIADALLTTQLGLVCAIPGWLLHAWIQSKIKRELNGAVSSSSSSSTSSTTNDWVST